jgi:hypothetical protein
MTDNAEWNHFSHIVASVVLLALIASAATSQAGTLSANNVPAITVDDEGFSGPAWEYSPALSTLQDLPGRGEKLGVPTPPLPI